MRQREHPLVKSIDYYNNRPIKANQNGLRPVQYRIQAVFFV